ncbi:MAG: type II toxin-antitoxin system prevent-host-death family antitoxin, partial [Gemmatimonadales bacterium]
IFAMKAVGIRELKNRLSEYIRQVRRGEQILVTDRGVVVAELRQPGPRASDTRYPGLVELARQGGVRLGPANRPDLYPALEPGLTEGSAAELLDQERGER